ncbi:MAG: biopolymer transporter ExbD [Planctomycetaceae bacterium]|nr:biopolymer transporter ExbD [Planctomycetaceae bacterium]
MRAPRQSTGARIGFNMTPMIDISFLLIVFFIVSSRLAQQEIQLELDLPQAASGEEPELEPTGRRLIVNVLPQGSLMAAGAPVDAADLEALIASERAKAGAELEVRIRSDRHVPYRFIEPILLACTRTGVWKVTFAVTQRAAG